MNIRRFPATAFATVTLAMWVHSIALVVAQETSSPDAAPSSAAVPVAEPVQLSSGAADILKLSRAKVNDDVTVAFIQQGDRRSSLAASEIVYLRERGVSDRVLTAMLNQQPQFEPAPQPAAPATALAVSAPQYATPPTTTAFAETAPASTLYVAPSTPTYYSFYDPWPYWYEPWPYWYTSYSCGYPFFTFGFSWGNCNYGYWRHNYGYNSYWNNCGHDGNHQSPPHHGNHPTPNGNSPTRDGRSGSGGKNGMQASNGRPSGGVNQTGLRSGPGPSARTAQSTARAGLSTDNRSQPVAPRASASQIKGPRGGQGPSPASVGGSDANNRTAARDSIGNKGGIQFTRNSQPVATRTSATPASDLSTRSGQPAGLTRIWTGSSAQGPATRNVVRQSAPSIAGPSRVSASPTTVWNRSASQPASRPAVSPAASYQRSSFGPSYSSRGNGSVAGISRPSMSSSYGSMGSPSTFRGGGGFSGSSAPRMSSGGGGFRGGGGGGFASGGSSRGGGGGGGGGGRYR